MANALYEKYFNISNWKKNMDSFPVFENTYADGVNTLTYKGGGGIERIYIPIEVRKNFDYTFKFNFCSPSGFTIGTYGHDAAFAFIRTSEPNDSGAALQVTNLAVSQNWDTKASEIPKGYTIQFNSGNYTTLYVALDFGYIKDGVSATFVFSDFALEHNTPSPKEYLRSAESDGTQHINLEYTHTAETKIELDCIVRTVTDRSYVALFGSRLNSYKYNAFIFFSRQGGNDIPLYNRTGSNVRGTSFVFEERITLTCYREKATWVKENGVSETIINTGTIDGGVAPLFLWALNSATAAGGLKPSNQSNMRVYSLKIYEGDELMRHYRPALDFNGVAYLHEDVQGYAYYPAAGNPLSYQRNGYSLVRSGRILYTVTDSVLSALTETELTASLFKTYGMDNLPDGTMLVQLSDPEVLYWQESDNDPPDISMTVTGAPPLPLVFTSKPMDLTHESIAGIDHAAVDASEDVRFAISFDDGASWKAFDGSAWFDTNDTAPGMLPSTMNAITAEQWAEVVVLESYMVRFWLPNVTAYAKSVVMHYINP